jgi:hypothetical protein
MGSKCSVQCHGHKYFLHFTKEWRAHLHICFSTASINHHPSRSAFYKCCCFFPVPKIISIFLPDVQFKATVLVFAKKAYRGCTLLEESGQNYHDSLQLGKQNRDMQCNLVALTAMKLQVKILIILLQMIFKILIIT